jgi:hypothetical protein
VRVEFCVGPILILCQSAFWHVFTLPEESVEVVQLADRLSERERERD